MLALSRAIWITHEYQSDSSSKKPAPSTLDAHNDEKSDETENKNVLTNVNFTIDKGRSISDDTEVLSVSAEERHGSCPETSVQTHGLIDELLTNSGLKGCF